MRSQERTGSSGLEVGDKILNLKPQTECSLSVAVLKRSDPQVDRYWLFGRCF
jgi:hypothetical protein